MSEHFPESSVDESKKIPFSNEGEVGVLGSVMLAPNENMGECIQRGVRASCFYDLRHQIIFDTFLEFYEDNEAFDIITLQAKLRLAGKLELVGGIAYLLTLPDAVPSAAHLEYYIEIVREKYVLRQLLAAATTITQNVYKFSGNVMELLDSSEALVHGIASDNNSRGNRTMKELVDVATGKIEQYHQQGGKISGLTTGILDFDRLTWGVQEADMVVIAARPSTGKSSLSMQIAEHVAVESKLPVCVFSLEMTDDQIVLRMLCSRSRVNLRNIRDGFMAERDFPKLIGAAGALSQAPIYIDDSAGLSILQLRTKARRYHQLYGIKLFVVDYLQLLSSHRKHGNRNEEVGYISNQIKQMARELRVPVIVLSQLNRELEKRGENAKPRLSDLRESGAIEQDADTIGFLYKIPPHEGNATDPDITHIGFDIAKQRNGPTGLIDLLFLRSITRFEAVARVEAEDVK